MLRKETPNNIKIFFCLKFDSFQVEYLLLVILRQFQLKIDSPGSKVVNFETDKKKFIDEKSTFIIVHESSISH